MDQRLRNTFGPSSILPITDVLDILKGLKTKYHQRLFLEQQLKDIKIEEGLEFFGDHPSFGKIPYFWTGVYLARAGDYSALPEGWEDDVKDATTLGVIAWDNYCQMQQWLSDIEEGKELKIGNDKPVARDVLATAHKNNGGRLTTEQIKQLAVKTGLAEKYLLNKYSEIVADLK
jgi:hypothetical protein